MKIKDIELTKEEVNQALTNLLNLHGIEMEVTDFEGVGYPVKSWRVSLESKPRQSCSNSEQNQQEQA